MLCQFTVRNYKSIRDEITLDMQAASISELKEHLLTDIDGQNFLPQGVLYGPNAGGKSNVLEALMMLVNKVINPIAIARAGSGSSRLEIKPFAFSEDKTVSPTEFEVFFRTVISEYRYRLYIKGEKVVYESLDRIKKETGRRSSLFVRNSTTMRLNGDLSKIKLGEGLSESLPLLSYLGIMYMSNSTVADVLGWFCTGIAFLDYGNPYQELSTRIARDGKMKSLILDMIKEIGLDIEDFRVEQRSSSDIEVYTSHIVNGRTSELTLSEESSGTRKVFGVLPFIAESLISGTTLVVDELDAKLHPGLLKYIICLYGNPEINRKGAQLVFTSHDLSTMNNELFRRDEIWFVAKGTGQNSEMYSLVEFKSNGESVRKDARYDKQYLEGKYGADPYFRKIVDWSVVNG